MATSPIFMAIGKIGKMKEFKIVQLDDGGYRFDLDAIKIYVDGFKLSGEEHLLNDPKKAIGYFNIDGNIYGISNARPNCLTAEDFFETMWLQYKMFTDSKMKQSA